MSYDDWQDKYEFVAGEENGDPYAWEQTDIWFRDGQFYTYTGSGCSCNGPYEGGESDLYGPMTFHEAIAGESIEIKTQALRWEANHG